MEVLRLIGGAGTGKTSELLRIMSSILDGGASPFEIGFVSFTRAARREAAERAADITAVASADLETYGWFRTLHSVCYACLGQKSKGLLANNVESRKWTEEAVKEKLSADVNNMDTLNGEFNIMDFEQSATNAAIALNLWNAARSRMMPLQDIWREATLVSDTNAMPDISLVRAIVDRYEQAKRLDGRVDFTDLLGRFAGIAFHIDGHVRTNPEGSNPKLKSWIFDECQDFSALLMEVCKRLVEDTDKVILAGDPFQSIYGFAGSDSKFFREWPASTERTMPKSYRCPKSIHELGETILRQTRDYWDRKIAPADHEGKWRFEKFMTSLFDFEIRPDQDWLLLSRTNFGAQRIASILRERNVPWKLTRGRGGWSKPSMQKAYQLFCAIEWGFANNPKAPIEPQQWAQVVGIVKSGKGEHAILERGTKSKFENDDQRPPEPIAIDRLGEWGATPRLISDLKSGKWHQHIEGAYDYVQAVKQWGQELVNEPKLRVGTIHSVKGAEADNVLWLTTGTGKITKACKEHPRIEDEESRVAYVAATRARRNLIVATEPNKKHRFRIDV